MGLATEKHLGCETDQHQQPCFWHISMHVTLLCCKSSLFPSFIHCTRHFYIQSTFIKHPLILDLLSFFNARCFLSPPSPFLLNSTYFQVYPFDVSRSHFRKITQAEALKHSWFCFSPRTNSSQQTTYSATHYLFNRCLYILKCRHLFCHFKYTFYQGTHIHLFALVFFSPLMFNLQLFSPFSFLKQLPVPIFSKHSREVHKFIYLF